MRTLSHQAMRLLLALTPGLCLSGLVCLCTQSSCTPMSGTTSRSSFLLGPQNFAFISEEERT